MLKPGQEEILLCWCTQRSRPHYWWSQFCRCTYTNRKNFLKPQWDRHCKRCM